MKTFILLLAILGTTVGAGLFAGEAQATGYWDYTMDKRGATFSGSASAAQDDEDSPQATLDLEGSLPSDDAMELEEDEEFLNEVARELAAAKQFSN